MARIDPNDPRPPYQQIASDLRRAIGAGELVAGARMASSRDLAQQYGVAPMTVHQAIRVLRDEGLVKSFQGRGVFVLSDQEPSEATDLPGQVEELRSRVDALAAQAAADVTDEVSDLRRQLGLFQAQLMDLYARTGHPYPHDQTASPEEGQSSTRRRKASGS